MQIELPPGEKVALYNSEEEELTLARKSVIKTTQEDQMKTVVLLVRKAKQTASIFSSVDVLWEHNAFCGARKHLLS